MTERGARAKLVVIDASRRNPYERRFRTFSHGLAPIDAPDNTLILTSATPGKVVDDSNGQYSVLVAELLNNLKDHAGAEAAFNKTRGAVARASEGEQVPSVSSSLLEDVQFGSDDKVRRLAGRSFILRDGAEFIIGPRFARTRWRLLRTLMVRSAATPRVSNQEADPAQQPRPISRPRW